MFAERIKVVRKECRETQQQMADKLNVSQRAVASWEMGTRMPSCDKLIEIADEYGVSTDYLLGRTSDPALYKHDLKLSDGTEVQAITDQKEPPTIEAGERLEKEIQEIYEAAKTGKPLDQYLLPADHPAQTMDIRRYIDEAVRAEVGRRLSPDTQESEGDHDAEGQ